jgi:predicted permease
MPDQKGPQWKREIRQRLRPLKLAPTRENAIVEELSQHLDDCYAEWLVGGMTSAEAYHRALAELSSSELLARELRRVERQVAPEPIVLGTNRRTKMIADLWQDLRFGGRMLAKQPGFTLIAVLSLALGVGANTAIFSLLDAVVLKTLPVREPQELVLFNWLSGPKRMARNTFGDVGIDPATGLTTSTSFSYLSLERLRDRNPSLVDVFAFMPRSFSVHANEQAEFVQGQLVSGGYYAGLGVQPVLGRTISVTDDQAAASPVAVITHRYWQRRFGSDPTVIGKTIKVNQIPCTVIGVTPPGFYGALQVGQAADVSIPLALEAQLSPNNARLNKPWVWWLRVMGRLKPEVSAERARGELELAFQQSAQEGWLAAPAAQGEQNQEPRDVPRLRAVDGSQGLAELRQKRAQSLLILMVVVGLVLLIACANIANLLLVRAATRRKEVAVRLALGAGRFRLIRQLLTESVLLASLGGVLGVVLAYWGKDLLLALQPWGGGELALNLKLDVRVLSFTTAISLLTGLLFGLTPALRATRLDLTPALKDTARNSSGDARSSLSKALVVAQVALSLVLLIGAGLFTRTLRNLQSLATGFNHENLVTFGLNPRLNNYPNAQITPLFQRLLERLEALPGVRAATLSQYPILAGSRNDAPIFVQSPLLPSSEGSIANVNDVAASFLDTLQIPILRGRGLTSQDDERAPKVAVVNQAFARKYFGNADPLGKRFGLDGAKNSGQLEIVGIAQDAKYFEMRGDMPPTVYLPYFQEPASNAYFTVRTTGEPTAMFALIRQTVREIDGSLPIFDFKTVRQQVESGWAQERLFATLSSFFGLLAVLLAAIGLYGVMAYSVTRRRNEIGIRMALGAARRDVIQLVLRESLLLVALGVGIGLATALATTRLISAQLFGLAPTDPLTITLATLLLLGVATLAGYLPARKAAQTDPMLALRNE